MPGNSRNLMVRMDFLPIYAAGDVTKEATRSQACTVLDRSISSYTPSFSELKYARQNAQAKRDYQSRLTTDSWSSLISSRSITSGQVPLPYVTQEVTEDSICITGKLYINTQATRKAILTSLRPPSTSIAHFICHGEANSTDPLRSQLLSYDSVLVKTKCRVRRLHIYQYVMVRPLRCCRRAQSGPSRT